MLRLIDWYLTAMEKLNTLVKWLCISLTSVMACVVILQVITRYIPGINPPSWTEELSRYLMIYSAFLGASTGIKNWKNISVDYFTQRMPPKVRLFLGITTQVLILAFLVVLTVLSISTFSKIGFRQKSASMNFPMFFPQSSIIVGCALMSLQLLGLLLKRVRAQLSVEVK